MKIISDTSNCGVTYDLKLRLELARIVNYNRNFSFIVLATVITIINYDRKTFVVQATDLLPDLRRCAGGRVSRPRASSREAPTHFRRRCRRGRGCRGSRKSSRRRSHSGNRRRSLWQAAEAKTGRAGGGRIPTEVRISCCVFARKISWCDKHSSLVLR
jgi:hypothetical protein